MNVRIDLLKKPICFSLCLLWGLILTSCQKDINATEPETAAIHASEPVTDFDGNVYQTIQIGQQIWMAENLRAAHYSDGTPIDQVVYDNDTSHIAVYGRLYSWSAAMRGRPPSSANSGRVQGAAPQGWHIPGDDEWLELIDGLGGESVAGGKLKETGTQHWWPPNTGATNEAQFNALPAGFLDFTGEFRGLGELCFFGTASAQNSFEVYIRELTSGSASVIRGGIHPDDAIPIRCVKD